MRCKSMQLSYSSCRDFSVSMCTCADMHAYRALSLYCHSRLGSRAMREHPALSREETPCMHGPSWLVLA